MANIVASRCTRRFSADGSVPYGATQQAACLRSSETDSIRTVYVPINAEGKRNVTDILVAAFVHNQHIFLDKRGKS